MSMLGLMLSLLAGQTVPSTPENYEAAVQCSAAHHVSGVIFGQLGDTAAQAEMSRKAEAFRQFAYVLGEPLGLSHDAADSAMLASAEAKAEPLRTLAQRSDPEAAITEWTEGLNADVAACRVFVDRLRAEGNS